MNNTYRTRFTLLALAGLSGFSLVAETSDKPNLILIFTDDLGYGDPGCYGGKLVPTPAINSLAKEGVRFTDAYVTAPICAASRVGIMTGAYNQRFGMQWNSDRLTTNIGKHQLMPQTLKASGYVTGHIGKWNVAVDANKCFDEVYDLIDWKSKYYPDDTGHYFGVDNPAEVNSGKDHVGFWWKPAKQGEEYLTDRMGRHAVEFIDKHKTQPFFLYLAFNAVHDPYQAKESDKERFAGIRPEPLNYYASMLSSLDENIGRVMKKLKDLKLDKNTIVIFTSDNGPMVNVNVLKWPAEFPKEIIIGSAGPLTGTKAQFLEGGIRIPYIVRWPKRLKGGGIYTEPVSTMDIYATFAAAAKARLSEGTKLDGVDLIPYLTGLNKGIPHDILFWKNENQGAVREGDWKLLINTWEPKLQLYNLKEDIGEVVDMLEEKPDMVEHLNNKWLQWSAGLPPKASGKVK
jgi:arylsulfatase A-like enzyme